MKKLFIILFLLVSCSTNYHIIYDTYLEGSKEKVNYFQDNKFNFEFTPVHNGLFFTIKNLTDKVAYLIWDRTYFIQPDGNSYKAINTDTLEEDKQISYKENYESILPPKSLFKRFTTSDINAHKFKSEDITIYKDYVNNISTEKIISSEWIGASRFWPLIAKKDDLINVTEYITNNNNMGIGFVIKQGEKEFEYNFNFKFKKASAMQEIKSYEMTKWVEKYSAEEDAWIWKKKEK